MAGITLAQAESRLSAIQTAIDSLISNKVQSISVDGRSYGYHDLATLEAMEARYDKLVQRLTRGGIRISGITPC